MDAPLSNDYVFPNAEGDHTRFYLWPPVVKLLQRHKDVRVFEIGCGNGAFLRHLKKLNIESMGVDPSEQGISLAKSVDPRLQVHQGSVYDPLNETYGTFDVVVSLEVISHVYYPRAFAACVNNLLRPGGLAIISTPYHGYWKTLSLALLGKFDVHFSPLWDHGLIKHWSVETLTKLFAESGLKRESVMRIGRVPPLAKTMVVCFSKPAT